MAGSVDSSVACVHVGTKRVGVKSNAMRPTGGSFFADPALLFSYNYENGKKMKMISVMVFIIHFEGRIGNAIPRSRPCAFSSSPPSYVAVVMI